MSRLGVRVRPAELADAPELARLALAIDTGDFPAAGRGTYDTSPKHLAERFRELMADPSRVLLVAVDESSKAITALLVARPDEVGAIDLTPAMHVTHLIVTPGARRRGVGRALLSSAVHIAEASGLDRMVVTAASGSRGANRYFARLGFAPLVVQRVTTTTALRRSLGMVEVPSRLATLRRVRAQRRKAVSASVSRLGS